MWFDVIRVTIYEMHVKCWKIVCKSSDPLFLLCRVRIHQMDTLNGQDCTILKSEWFNMLADSIHVKNRINWIHNKTGWNKQSTRQKKLKEVRVTSNHIKDLYHFIAAFPFPRRVARFGTFQFSKPRSMWGHANLSLWMSCILMWCHLNVYDVCIFRFFGTWHCGEFGHFESIPQYNHEASPGSRLRSWGRVMKENAFAPKMTMELNWI